MTLTDADRKLMTGIANEVSVLKKRVNILENPVASTTLAAVPIIVDGQNFIYLEAAAISPNSQIDEAYRKTMADMLKILLTEFCKTNSIYKLQANIIHTP